MDLFCIFKSNTMGDPASITSILSQAERLDRQDLKALLETLALLEKEFDARLGNSIRLSSLSGLGSELWQDALDIDKFLDAERQW